FRPLFIPRRPGWPRARFIRVRHGDLPRLTAQRLRQGEVITSGFPVLEKLKDGSRDLPALRAAYELAFSWHRVASILLGDRGLVAVALRSAQGAIEFWRRTPSPVTRGARRGGPVARGGSARSRPRHQSAPLALQRGRVAGRPAPAT